MSENDVSGVAGVGPRPEGAEVEMVDAGPGGTEEVVLRNRHLVARISPRRGGRLVELSPAGSEPDSPATAVLLDVGHDGDRWEVVAARPNAGGVEAVLGHVRGGCPLIGSLKIYRLGADDLYVAVDYRLAPLEQPFTVRCDLPPGTWAHVPDGEPLVWEPQTGPPPRRATSSQRSFTVHLGVGEPPTIDLRTEAEAEATHHTRS